MKKVLSFLLAKVVLDQEQGEGIGITLAVMILEMESITLCIIIYFFIFKYIFLKLDFNNFCRYNLKHVAQLIGTSFLSFRK